METRLLIAYGCMLAMALALAGIGFYAWYNARSRSVSRQRLREQRRYEERVAARAAAQAEDSR